MRGLINGGIGYTPASSTQTINLRLEGSKAMTQSYKANQSPGAAVGIGNTAGISGSTISIGVSPEQNRLKHNR